MIVEVINTDEIGKYIPNVNVKTVHLESDNNTNFINVFFYLQDEITENFSFRWYDEKELFDKIRVKTIAIFDKNIFNELSRDITKIDNLVYLDEIAKQYTLEFLLETPEIQYGVLTDTEKQKINSLKEKKDFSISENEIKKTLGDNLYDKINKLIESKAVKRKELIKTNDVILKDVVKKYEDIRSVKPETISTGEKKYYFFKNVKIDVEKQENIFLLCFSYLPDENGNIKIYGKINNEVVLQINKPPQTMFVYKDELNTFSKINTDPDVYKKTEYLNYKIKDLRFFAKELKLKKIDSKKIRYKKSKLYLSRSCLNEASGILNLNIDELLYDTSEIYKFFSNNKEVSKIIREYSKIKNLKITRRKIEKDNPTSSVYSFPSAKDNSRIKFLNPVDSDDFSIKEIRRPSVESDTNFHRYFTFKDRDSKNIKKGKYTYEVSLSLIDGTRKFIYNDILSGIQKNKEVIGLYIKDCEQNSLFTLGSSFFKESLFNIFEQKHRDAIANTINSLVSATLIFYEDISENELRTSMSASLHPLTSNLELVQQVYEFNLKLENAVNNILTLIEKIDPYNVELTQNNFYNNTSEIQAIINFPESIFQADLLINGGIEYIDYNPTDVRARAELQNSGVPIYNKKFLDTRVNREIRRYFINESANISFNTYNANDFYAKYLINQSLDSTKIAYFSPAYIDFMKESYDFVSLKSSNDYFAYQEAELRAINKTHNSKDKFFNAFYALNDFGILVNQINGKQRIVSGAPDTKNPSILEDYSKNTNISSKTQLSKMNFTSFAAAFANKDSSLDAFFEMFNQKSPFYLLKNLVDGQRRLSDEKIRENIKKLPIQLKSLLFKNVPQVADQITIDVQREKNNISFFSKAKIDYNLIKKIEYLEKFDSNREVWTLLDDTQFNKLKQSSSNLNIICRLANYNNEAMGEKIFEEFNLPTYNEYFLIDLENPGIISERDDKMEFFKSYNIRIQEINTIDPIEDKNYTDNIKKMLELF